MQHSTGPTALPTTTYSTCVRQTMSHSFPCSTPMIQAGTTAQPSPALVESQQPSCTHPVNATVLLHNPDNRFAASHTLYNSAPQLSVGSTLLCNQGNTTSLAPLVRAVTMPTQSVPSRISMRHKSFPCFTNCHIRKWTAAACVPCAAVSYPAPVLTAYSQIAVRSLPATFCDPCTLTGRGLPHYCLRAVLMGA